jgi:hypothetical protein
MMNCKHCAAARDVSLQMLRQQTTKSKAKEWTFPSTRVRVTVMRSHRPSSSFKSSNFKE